jgi:hypothetical protein
VIDRELMECFRFLSKGQYLHFPAFVPDIPWPFGIPKRVTIQIPVFNRIGQDLPLCNQHLAQAGT